MFFLLLWFLSRWYFADADKDSGSKDMKEIKENGVTSSKFYNFVLKVIAFQICIYLLNESQVV